MDTITEKQPSVSSVALKYGLIFGLISVVYSLILMLADLGTNKWLGGLGYIILIVAIVVAIKEFKQRSGGFMSYGQGLGIGTLISAVVGLLGGIFMWAYTSFVDTNYMSNMMEQQRIELENRGMSDEQIDAALEMGQKFQGPLITIFAALIGYVIIGFIISLIISAIMKNTRPEFE
ncbi:DUF4199 domain-containing protein [Pontibacter sp. SGAir0037]|uniref:DUF4199 domain-containing protein n=1 Tax=Pontibacter sp. SGAir0037 TaxID=2571030 RepID=UPI0010CD5D17|nr:DUF4199 domain-containing protein [Pontibacter sp. SGAir0037]QCR23212.1 DUF4199 domain-containing protein [Pontibacter sp. SGAir0037]